MIQFSKKLEDACFSKWKTDSKIGIFASVSPEGYPHMALITSLMAKTPGTAAEPQRGEGSPPATVMWGQFSRGLSKKCLETNPKTGFAVVTADMMMWTGKALHKEMLLKGDDYEWYNNKPLFRYNSYFGIGAVHYEDVVDVSAGEKLSIRKIACGVLAGNYAKCFVGKGAGEAKIPEFGMNLASKIDTLKFVSYVDTDGYPRIIPALQGIALDSDRLLFSLSNYPELLTKIPAGAKVAVYLCTMSLTSILLQGTWTGIKSYGGVKAAVFEVDKVYNSMVPVGRYIYPPEPLKVVFGA